MIQVTNESIEAGLQLVAEEDAKTAERFSDIDAEHFTITEEKRVVQEMQTLLLQSIQNHLRLQTKILIAILEKIEAVQVSDNK